MTSLKRDLSFFDLMNIVIGAAIGSDIFVVPGLIAGLIGPFSITIWILGGVMAMILATVFAYCSYYVPNVGGSFAFVSEAFNEFWGFLAGWSMSIAEIIALPVFAIVFTNYLQWFIPFQLSYTQQAIIRIIFVIALTAVNIGGVKAAGRLNDVLTMAKLTPLLLIIVLGLGSLVFKSNPLQNYSPFAPYGYNAFGPVLVLIFWAYAGFELGSLPASEVVDPKRTIPKAMITGMAIVTAFYVLVSVAVFGVVDSPTLAKSSIPLVVVSIALIGVVGAVITGLGALASVSGTDETEVLGTARLLYAMSIDGLLPKVFSRVHPKFQTPYAGVVIEGGIALVLSLFTGISQLISFAVFNLGVCYLLVCLALTRLKKSGEHGLHGQSILPWLGILISAYIIYSTTLNDKLVGLAVILMGVPVYLKFAPKKDIEDLKRDFTSDEAVLARNLEKQERFLANLVRLLGRRPRRKTQTS